ncbi:MAG: metallophosphoesterase family protein [Candidatus Syntropharchaeia archaeon]
MGWIHSSDFHLGYRQYNLYARFEDFGRVFEEVASFAIRRDADFFLICGDLFHHRNIGPDTYLQANKVLRMLKESEIPVICIEGNHDLAYHRDSHSWLHSLEKVGLLNLITIKPWKEGELMGDYIEMGEYRIFGMKYIGATTARTIPKILDEIKRINRSFRGKTILMMHAGIEGKLGPGIGGELSYRDIAPLREVVDYLALGHYHIQYSIENWIFNGGSPETVSASEVGHRAGFYVVEGNTPKLIETKRRPFIREKIRTDPFRTPEELYSAVETRAEELSKKNFFLPPMVEITLHGRMNFDRHGIDVRKMEKKCAEILDALWCGIKINVTRDTISMDEEFQGLKREDIEMRVFTAEMERDSALRPHARRIARDMIHIKKLALSGANPEEILKTARQSFDDIYRRRKCE